MKTGLYLLLIIAVFFAGCNFQQEKNSDAVNDSIPPELKVLNDKIAGNSNDPKLYTDRAGYYFKHQKYELALRDLQFALDSDKNNVPALVLLSQVYIHLGNAQKALESVNKALAINPDHIEALTVAAEINLILQNYREVFANVDKALILDKRNPKAFYLRGYALIEAGDTLSGIKNLKVASDQDPAHYEANWLLGLTFAALKDPEAELYFNKAIGIQPRNPDFYYQLGLFYQENEMPEKALTTYRTIIQIDSNYTNAYFNTGFILLIHNRDFRKAAEQFSKAISKDGKYYEAWFNRGFCHENLHEYEKARKDYQECLKIKPNYEKAVEALNRLDRIQFKIK